MMKHILIIGATSAIAQSAAHHFARDGAQLVITGRNTERLQILANDLKVQGARAVTTITADMTDFARHEEWLKQAIDSVGGELDAVLIAHGSLSDQAACEKSFELTRRELDTNFLSVVSLVTFLANYFQQKQRGLIAVITSVAGDRGRQSNYIYGTAKGALGIFLQGLRNRLFKSGVGVLTIKPGFVDTPMTVALTKNLLFASAESVGLGIYNAMIKRKDQVYLPRFWRLIMCVIECIPEFLFKRLKL